MANSVDPDEMAHYEPSCLDLHCLQRYLFWSAWLKGLNFLIFLLQAKNLKQMPLVLFGILTVIGGILCIALPETHNKPLPDTIEDVENKKQVTHERQPDMPNGEVFIQD